MHLLVTLGRPQEPLPGYIQQERFDLLCYVGCCTYLGFCGFILDIPLVIVLFILIFLAVLFGGLHMYLPAVYFFILFIIFNVVQVY